MSASHSFQCGKCTLQTSHGTTTSTSFGCIHGCTITPPPQIKITGLSVCVHTSHPPHQANRTERNDLRLSAHGRNICFGSEKPDPRFLHNYRLLTAVTIREHQPTHPLTRLTVWTKLCKRCCVRHVLRSSTGEAAFKATAGAMSFQRRKHKLLAFGICSPGGPPGGWYVRGWGWDRTSS